ncbi:MAG: hypothetical protein AAF570_27790, partial [Bacteroidota bacterium]
NPGAAMGQDIFFSRTKAGPPVTDCDCAQPLNELWVTYTIPETVREYDLMSVDIVDAAGSLRRKDVRRVGSVKPGQVMTYQVMDPKNAGERLSSGLERLKFHAKGPMGISYDEICHGKKTVQLSARILAVKKVGEQVEYRLMHDDMTIREEVYDIFSDAVELGRSSEMGLTQLEDIGEADLRVSDKRWQKVRRNFKYLGYTVGIVSIGVLGYQLRR